MPADLRLQYETTPSAPTIQVKGLLAYAIPLKLDASSQVIKAHNQDEIHNNGWPRWQKKNWRWCRHGFMTRTF